MADFDYECKMLHLEIKENEEKYISGEKSLEEPLKKTDELYEQALKNIQTKNSNASKFSHDSSLMQLQSKIVRQRAKHYKPDTLIFNPREFSEKLKRHFLTVVSNEEKSKKLSVQQSSVIWQKLGEESQKFMHTVPTFDFVYGTFDAEPAAPVTRKRKRVDKDKLKDAVKPKTVDVTEEKANQDVMIDRVHRTFSFLKRILEKSKTGSVCFYEFVIDPTSFTRTIENIFSVTMLLKAGSVRIFADDQDLPCLSEPTEEEKNEKKRDPSAKMQSVLSMSVEEWQTIIKKGNFTRPLIPPSKSQLKSTQAKS